MMETKDDLFEMESVCLSVAVILFFWGFIVFDKFLWGGIELIDLIRTHFQGGFSFFIKLVSLLICEWRETVGCIWEIILFFIFEDLIDFA